MLAIRSRPADRSAHERHRHRLRSQRAGSRDRHRPRRPQGPRAVAAWRAAAVLGERLPLGYRRKLAQFPHAPAVFKIDYALDGPIPWTAEPCRRAGTVHLGGTFDEIAASERDAVSGRVSARPFVLLAQHTLFDPTRAPAGKHTAWAYCHLPYGSGVDQSAAIGAQIERFAPGFGKLILARRVSNPAALEAQNANLVGGDISGGSLAIWRLLARPTLSPTPYRLPGRGLYLCSSSTPPGGGVHGMCGYHAARAALAPGACLTRTQEVEGPASRHGRSLTKPGSTTGGRSSLFPSEEV